MHGIIIPCLFFAWLIAVNIPRRKCLPGLTTRHAWHRCSTSLPFSPTVSYTRHPLFEIWYLFSWLANAVSSLLCQFRFLESSDTWLVSPIFQVQLEHLLPRTPLWLCPCHQRILWIPAFPLLQSHPDSGRQILPLVP